MGSGMASGKDFPHSKGFVRVLHPGRGERNPRYGTGSGDLLDAEEGTGMKSHKQRHSAATYRPLVGPFDDWQDAEECERAWALRNKAQESAAIDAWIDKEFGDD